MTQLAIRNLSVTLGVPLFSGLDLVIGKGDRIGLVAANGRGKSTLLRCLSGTYEPTTGEITRAHLEASPVNPDLVVESPAELLEILRAVDAPVVRKEAH